MSYIRPGSNPEKLYVVGCGSSVEVYYGAPGTQPCVIPVETWDELCWRWVDGDNAYDEAYTKDASVVFQRRDEDWKVYLSYGDHEVEMWEVTWAYITSRYEYERRRRYSKLRYRILNWLQWKWWMLN